MPVTTLSWLPRTTKVRVPRSRTASTTGWGGAVAHQVAQNEDGVEALPPGVTQDDLEGIPVAVHVGEDQVAHQRFPIKSAILAATSSGPSSTPMSIVTSARR